MDTDQPLSQSGEEPRYVFSEPSYEDRDFAGLSCRDAELDDLEFFQCRFSGCQFLRSIFRRCRFEQCVFSKSDLSLLKAPESSFVGVRFLNAKMLGIDWTLAAVPLALAFQGCNISHSMFMRLSLQKMEMVECVAREVDFSGAVLARSILAGTDFLGSRFADTDLRYADLTRATNYAIDPTKNRVKKAVFSLPEALSLLSAWDIVLK